MGLQYPRTGNSKHYMEYRDRSIPEVGAILP